MNWSSARKGAEKNLLKLEDIYSNMSDTVLQGLRRRLPVTRVKFDWDNKASVHKLASELQKK